MKPLLLSMLGFLLLQGCHRGKSAAVASLKRLAEYSDRIGTDAYEVRYLEAEKAVEAANDPRVTACMVQLRSWRALEEAARASADRAVSVAAIPGAPVAYIETATEARALIPAKQKASYDCVAKLE